MEGSLVFLFAALLVTWVTIAIYLMMLGGRVTSLRRDVENLKRELPDGGLEERPRISPR